MSHDRPFDIAVGLVLPPGGQPAPGLVENIAEGMATYFSTYRWTLIHAHTEPDRRETPPAWEGVENQIPVAVPWTGVQHVTYPWHGLPAKSAAYHGILTHAERCGAEVCLLVDAAEAAFTPAWVDALVRPGLHSRYDLVTPSHGALAGRRLISGNLLSPLLTGLFGAGASQPMSGTLLVSGALGRRLLARHDWHGSPARSVPELWMNFTAAAEGFRRAEAFVAESRALPAAAILPPYSAVTQILESTFSLMEQYESRWPGTPSSALLDQFGRPHQPEALPEAEAPDGLDHFIRFAESYAALEGEWRTVLDPHTLGQVRGVYAALLDGEAAPVLADPVWVRIVYEFAGAWKRRRLPRHRVAALFVPLYWARLGSFLLRTRGAPAPEVAHHLGLLRNYFLGLRPVLDRLWSGQRGSISEAA